MTPLAPLAFLLFPPLVLAAFAVLPARRAALGALIAGWLLLPVAEFRFAGWPDPDKVLVTCGAVALGIVLFDGRRLMRLRPAWIDAPVIAFCLSPAVTSVLAGLGAHEAASAVLRQGLRWAVPYLVGRLYCGSEEGLRALARGLFAGGLAYAPLCVYEMVAGPQLHRMVYGFYPFDLRQAFRLGGWRPSVFQDTGLMAALWMGAASIAGLWVFRRRRLAAGGLALVTIAMRSVNAVTLLAGSVALLWASTRWRTRRLMLSVVVAIPLFVGVRASGLWTGEAVGRRLAGVSAEKAESLSYRFLNENIVAANTRARPFWGLGRGRQMLAAPNGGEAVCDSLWIIVYGQFGAAGLCGLLALGLLPVVWFVRAVPAARWGEAALAPAAALAMILVAAMVDNLFNDMGNPLFTVAAGGLGAFSAGLLRAQRETGDGQPAVNAPHQQAEPGGGGGAAVA